MKYMTTSAGLWMVKRCSIIPHWELHLALKRARWFLKDPQSVHTAISQQLFWNIFLWKLHGKLFIYRLYAFPGNPPSRHTPPQVPVHWLTSIVNATYDTLGSRWGLLQVFKMWEVRAALYLWLWNNAGTPPDLRYAFHRLRERERTGVKEPYGEHPGPDLVKPYSLRLRLL